MRGWLLSEKDASSGLSQNYVVEHVTFTQWMFVMAFSHEKATQKLSRNQDRNWRTQNPQFLFFIFYSGGAIQTPRSICKK